jgi:hypothetical protein
MNAGMIVSAGWTGASEGFAIKNEDVNKNERFFD